MPSLLAILGLDANPFKSGLEQARIHGERLGRRIGAGLGARIAGFLSAGALAAAVKHTVDWAGKLQDVSDALGVSVEWLQKMQNGAATAGGKIEDLEKMMIALNQAREDAIRNPAGDNAKSFKRLGFGTAELASVPAEDFFNRLVKQFAKGGSTQIENDVVQVGGKAAKNLLAAFHNQFMSEVPVVSEAIVEQLDELGDKWTTFTQTLTAGLAPAITTVIGWIQAFINKIKEIGAFIGGFVGSYANNVRTAPKNLTNEDKYIDAIDKSFTAAGQAAQAEADRQKKEADEARKAREERAAARKKRREAPPLDLEKVYLEDLKAPKSERAASIDLNALQKIGGFAAVNQGQLQMQKDVSEIASNVRDIARNDKPTERSRGVIY